MIFAGSNRLCALSLTLMAVACGGDGGGGGTEPPGPPAQLVKSGGDAQNWYFNNPLPAPYSVTVRDANGRAVPNVSVDWGITTGGGTLSSNPSATSASGVASTTHTLGTATTYVVTATVTGLPAVTFSASASAPPTSAAVNVGDNVFTPGSAAVQVNGTVTWTWVGGNPHSVTFGTGTPTSATQTAGSYDRMFTSTGTFSYFCKVHSGMTGTVRVVN